MSEDPAPVKSHATPGPAPFTDRLALALAALGPCGFSPIVPATVASFVLAVAYAFLPPIAAALDAAFLLAITVIAVWAAGRAERAWGHDAKRIVIDEGAGMAMTLLAQPAGWEAALIGFFAFRVFDVLKPFPGRRAEKLPGGFGVVADDLLAGVYAHLALRAVLVLLAHRAP
jgi:phosphatidylglycerophosphatase A